MVYGLSLLSLDVVATAVTCKMFLIHIFAAHYVLCRTTPVYLRIFMTFHALSLFIAVTCLIHLSEFWSGVYI